MCQYLCMCLCVGVGEGVRSAATRHWYDYCVGTCSRECLCCVLTLFVTAATLSPQPMNSASRSRESLTVMVPAAGGTTWHVGGREPCLTEESFLAIAYSLLVFAMFSDPCYGSEVEAAWAPRQHCTAVGPK